MKKEYSFQQILSGKLNIHIQKNEIDPYLIPYSQIYPKWKKDSKIRPQSIKVLEKHLRPKLHDINFENTFLGNNFLTAKALAKIKSKEKKTNLRVT